MTPGFTSSHTGLLLTDELLRRAASVDATDVGARVRAVADGFDGLRATPRTASLCEAAVAAEVARCQREGLLDPTPYPVPVLAMAVGRMLHVAVGADEVVKLRRWAKRRERAARIIERLRRAYGL